LGMNLILLVLYDDTRLAETTENQGMVRAVNLSCTTTTGCRRPPTTWSINPILLVPYVDSILAETTDHLGMVSAVY
jgi:hypothetical protein